MLRSFDHVGKTYELSFQAQAGGEALPLDFHGARKLLRTPMVDALGMRRLRSLLATRTPDGVVARMTDADVVEALATHVAVGQLRVYSQPRRQILSVVAATTEPESALGPLPPEEVVEPVEDNVDVPAQVAILLQAAKTGVPFCEECEKARLEEEAAALAEQDPPEAASLANLDVAAQVATMREASAAGAPFCEECERARLAQQPQVNSGGGAS